MIQEIIKIVNSRHKRKFQIKFLVDKQKSGCSFCIYEKYGGSPDGWLCEICYKINSEFNKCATPKKLYYT